MPVLVQVSQATLERGSCLRSASRTASETWSQSLSVRRENDEKDRKQSCRQQGPIGAEKIDDTAGVEASTEDATKTPDVPG
jgi:hypothetical protein